MTAEDNIRLLEQSRYYGDILKRTGDVIGVKTDKFPLPDHEFMLKLGELIGTHRALKKVLR